MSDGSDPSGFDPCECIWNQELAMRRLINLVKSTSFAVNLLLCCMGFQICHLYSCSPAVTIITVILQWQWMSGSAWISRTDSKWVKHAISNCLLGCSGFGAVSYETSLTTHTRWFETQWSSGKNCQQLFCENIPQSNCFCRDLAPTLLIHLLLWTKVVNKELYYFSFCFFMFGSFRKI